MITAVIRLMNRIAYILIVVFLIGCKQQANDSPSVVEAVPEVQDAFIVDNTTVTESWRGIYVSTCEISGFSGTAMSLGPLEDGQRKYRKHFYSCVSMDLPELPPIIEANENILTITERYEFRTSDGALHDPIEHETKYTRKKINGHIVLLRDDALKQFELDNKLYDYGVLVKISDNHDSIDDLSNAPHPSIRDLYGDPELGWNDPFVHGANTRK